ncbi:immunoglobulin domain-containing protein [Luteolibacter arcticus]|uniref:Immunoglobulin domain-containing protein n=1 Tax=Luteolibacter arcticus TaxID=1581411 RepID=A0ABT3GLY2_9BACT|nr:immunoglobulin domain-containing protein [Luteolibacter arcticus]MCW1924534.1 immunoglobulin domain-containing protein [Luteolibacter arcticus]
MKKQIALVLAATFTAQASTVSWNYDRNGTVSGSAVAGVSPAANWNNSWPTNPTTNLIDKNGEATTLDLAYASFNNWNIQASHPGVDGDGSSNKELLNGYLNAGPAGWNPPVTSSSVTISQIPYPDYKIIVYFSSDGADREGTVSDGVTTYYFKMLGAASISGSNATLTQATDTTAGGYAIGANYAVFDNLTGASQVVTVQMRDNDEWGGIAGFQVVADLGTVPEFGLQPEDQSAAVNSTATFTASAVADPAPTYEWEYSANGTSGWELIDDQTSATLVLNGITFADEGYYRVIATNTNTSVTSDTAFLDVFYAEPSITTQPADTYAVEGSSVQLSVSATGYEALTYQWYKNSTLLSGETAETLTLSNVDGDVGGVYFVEVTDSVEAGLKSTSDNATVVVFPPWNGLVSHDAIDTAAGYAIGELPLQDPTITGYVGAWTEIDFGDAEPGVIAGSLTYADPLYLGSSGDHVGKAADAAGVGADNSGRTYRKLAPAQVVVGNTTGTRYLSWLYRNGNENAVAQPYVHSVLSLYQDTGGANPSGDAARRTFEAGISDADFATTNFGFRYNDSQVGNLNLPVDGNVHLFVVKFDLSDAGGGDSLTVWIDPALGSGEPVGGSTLSDLDIAFDSLAFSDYASNSVAWDEVRWGSSFDSVTLNTNPPANFAAWIAGYPGVGEFDGFDQDADHDGLANGVENYFGTDPSATNAGITQVAKSGSTVTFQHPQSGAPASDVSGAYRWSSDLGTWHDSGEANGGTTVTFVASANTPSAGITTVTATITGTAPAKLFTQLRVSQDQ